MLAFAIAAVAVLFAGAAVSWLKRIGRLTTVSAALVGVATAVLLTSGIVIAAIAAPQQFGEPPARGIGELPQPTKITDVQLPTL